MELDEKYPFYPELPEDGKQAAQALVDQFKVALAKAADEAISDLYCDVAVYIESDSWTNYRNAIMSAFKNYNNKVKAPGDFKEIRQGIYQQFRDEIIVDLNQDLVKEVADLKATIEMLQQRY